jgi:signal peptidase I
MIKHAVAFFFDILQTVVLAAAMFVIVYLFIAQPHIVKGTSMEPSFLNGDYILTEKVMYKFNDPQRGDVVVFEAPNRPNTDYIKRVIALPGETFKVENGEILVNGAHLEEIYEPNETNPGQYIKESQEITVPENTYIMLGDNRPHSSDSREFGPVSKDTIVGRAIVRYWPFNRFMRIHRVEYK